MYRTVDAMVNARNTGGAPCHYFGDLRDWFVVAAVHRDSSARERWNFRRKEARYRAAADDDLVAVERFSHWAVGWVDYLLVDPGHPRLRPHLLWKETADAA